MTKAHDPILWRQEVTPEIIKQIFSFEERVSFGLYYILQHLESYYAFARILFVVFSLGFFRCHWSYD